jgi:hypothetical protein
MKKYIPEKMVKLSRYQNFFPAISEDIRRERLWIQYMEVDWQNT